MAKPKKFTQHMIAKFEPPTFERIAAATNEGENRADFVRAAVERELLRRAEGER